MFVTVISVALALFGADPTLKTEPAESIFRDDLRLMSGDRRDSSEFAAAKLKLEKANAVQHETLFQMPVATVNGQILIGADVLSRYSVVLKTMRESTDSDGYPSYVRQLIERELVKVVTATVLEQARCRKLSVEQRQEWEAKFDHLFGKEVERLKKEVEVETDADLKTALTVRGTTLVQVRSEFHRHQLATEQWAIISKPDENESGPDARKRALRQIRALVAQTDVCTAFNWKPEHVTRDDVTAALITK